MASSSSYNHNKNYTYDVFLSFSGEDTRKTFVDHLYAALDQQGINTFKDDEKLEKGRRINDDLLQSIAESRLYIVVFSKRYASSSWCLDELLKIMECHNKNEHTAFPVFYDVDPSEVRKQSGSVGRALGKHRNRNKSEVAKWRDALKEAADLSGWDVRKTADGHEAKVIKLIVEKVSLELRPTNIIVDKNLIGMEQRIKDLDSCLEIRSNDVRMIGIKGMGGAGKTTLARAVFDKISINFDGISFVENVRERASQSGLKKLQKQILKDVLKENSITISGVYEGKRLMKKKLCTKKVLLVLDDVDDKEQLEMLAGDSNWFKTGSRIIITTRDKQVLDAHRVKWIHDVNLLSKEEAMCLFSRHAFGKYIPTQLYERNSREVVDYAAGLPLTIKVLGSNLYGKDHSEWIDVLERLKTIPLKETSKILELSYKNLEDEHKEIFLDVACFLKGWEKDDAIIMLESCGFYAENGLRVLEQKSLITLKCNYGSYIEMHDHLVEMGKNIVRREHMDEPNRHSRLWVQANIEYVLACDSCNEATRCIELDITPTIDLEGLVNMKKLRFLKVNYQYSKVFSCELNESCRYFPNSLQYLCWHRYPLWCLPKTFEANNLVALKMSNSKLKQLWNGGKVLKQLKFLDLSHSKLLRSLNLGLAPNLERLELDACSDLVKLYMHDEKVMKKLKVLSLAYTKLRRLDLGLMPNLERLLVPFCHDLVKLYVHGGCLKSLVYLDISACNNLESLLFIEWLESLKFLHMDLLNLRESFDYIFKIHSNNSLLELHLSGNDLERLPSSIGSLDKLMFLSINSCCNLKCFPGSICSLQRLRTLELKFSGIEELTDDFGQLECLEKLNLTGIRVKHLPRSICMLKRLRTLLLECCSILEKLPEDVGQLESLVELNLEGCKNLRDIPNNICKLKHLKELKLKGCRMLEKLPERLGDLECLQILSIQDTCITHLPFSISLLSNLKIEKSKWKDKILADDFIQLCSKYNSDKCRIQGFRHLRTLDVGRCSIKELPEALGHLECLEELNLSYTHIKHLPESICMLKQLKKLLLQHCVLLEKLPYDVGRLESLEVLDLLRCFQIQEIPNGIFMLKHLKMLILVSCGGIEELPKALRHLKCLEELHFSCTNVKLLLDSICMLKHLKKLILRSCLLLEKLSSDVGQLESLEVLDLSRCYSIREIPNSICMLKHLKKLILQRCVLLEKLPGDVGHLESLDVLDLSRCYSIREIPNSICVLKQLKILVLYHCFCLEKLPEDVGQLESLEILYLSRCYNMRELPNSICNLKHLKQLYLEGCRRIQSLPENLGEIKSLQILTIWDTAISHLSQSIYSLNDLKISTENSDEPNHKEPLEDFEYEELDWSR